MPELTAEEKLANRYIVAMITNFPSVDTTDRDRRRAIFRRTLTLAIRDAEAAQREWDAQQVCMWLGYWRDKVPPEAVTQLQDLIGADAIAEKLKQG